jgi:hypothetical protein
MTILHQRYFAPNQDRAFDVGIILENRYQLRRVRYSTLREPRLIKFKFSEQVIRGARTARPKRAHRCRCSLIWNFVANIC